MKLKRYTIFMVLLGLLTASNFTMALYALTTTPQFGWQKLVAIIYLSVIVVCVTVMYLLVSKHAVGKDKYLFQLQIGRNNCGLWLVSKNEKEFHDIVILFLAEHGNNYSLHKLVEFLKTHDSEARPIAYQTVAILVTPVPASVNIKSR